MGAQFSLPRLLGLTDPSSIAVLDSLEDELLLRIVRTLVKEEPMAVGRLLCASKTFENLMKVRSSADFLKLFAQARRAVAREWLHDLRVLAGQAPRGLSGLVRQISRQLSDGSWGMRPDDEPLRLDLSQPWRWAAELTWAIALRRVLRANTSITYLRLDDCGGASTFAHHLAAGLQANSTLTEVDMRNNVISGDDASQIASAVLANTTIEMFNKIPIKELRAGSLTELIGDSRSLATRGIGIGVVGGLVVAGLIHVAPSLASLDLSYSRLCGVWTEWRISWTDPGRWELVQQCGTYTATAITALGAALGASPSLTSVNLSFNELGPDAAVALAPGIAASSSLTKLNLSHNKLDKELGTWDTLSAAECDAATRLGWSATSWDDDEDPPKKWEQLTENEVKDAALLGYTKQWAEVGQGLATLVPSILVAANASLTEVTFDDGHRGIHGHRHPQVVLPIQKLKGTHPVELLDFSRWGKETTILGPASGVVIGSLIRYNTSLTLADFSGHGLGPDFAKALAPAVAASTSLRELRIQDNDIEDVGANAIATALRMNSACALTRLVVDDDLEEHAGLKAACQLRGVQLA